jgi:hypothetical protein
MSIEALKLTTDHHSDHSIAIDFIPDEATGVLSVTQSDDSVGNLFDLVEAVRNVNDAHLMRPQVPDDCKQPPGFGEGQAGRRLVHDQNASLRRKDARNLDQLLLGQGQLAKRGSARNPEADLLEFFIGRRIDAFAIDQLEEAKRAADGGLASEKMLAATSRLSRTLSS